MDLRDWVQKATVSEFADRIDADPGFLSSCDSGLDAFGVLHHAAAVGRNDLVQMLLEWGVNIDMPTGTPSSDGESEAEPPKFDPGYTPLMCAAATGNWKRSGTSSRRAQIPSRMTTAVARWCILRPPVDRC